MSQSDANAVKQFNLSRIVELIDKVIERESIPHQGETYADLGWIKFYARELAKECKPCNEESKNENAKRS